MWQGSVTWDYHHHQLSRLNPLVLTLLLFFLVYLPLSLPHQLRSSAHRSPITTVSADLPGCCHCLLAISSLWKLIAPFNAPLLSNSGAGCSAAIFLNQIFIFTTQRLAHTFLIQLGCIRSIWFASVCLRLCQLALWLPHTHTHYFLSFSFSVTARRRTLWAHLSSAHKAHTEKDKAEKEQLRWLITNCSPFISFCVRCCCCCCCCLAFFLPKWAFA